MSTEDNFFEQQKEKSKVKTMIVTDFLKAYFPIINNSVGKDKSEIIYIDLFCGPGEYDDGQLSTPLVLLDLVNNFKSDDIRNKLRIVFNDGKREYIEKLKSLVYEHEVKPKLKYCPIITNNRAGEVDITVYTKKQVPIFSFIDPWGYKDVSAKQTWALVKNIGSDCVLFFNANRFLMDSSKEIQLCHFEPIFGDELCNLKRVVDDITLTQKEKAQKTVELFAKNLSREMASSNSFRCKLYILPFSFEADDKERISHYIIFITKSHKAIVEMKRVMLKHSNENKLQLGFDSKDQLKIYLFNRDYFIYDEISNLIKEVFQSNPSFFDRTWTVASLLDTLDRYNMDLTFQVTPFSVEEVKDTINTFYQKGFVQLVLDKDQKTKKAITLKREFQINKGLLV